MPRYEYYCKKCKKKFEESKTVEERDDCKCPKCGDKADRGIAAPPFHLKGSGWTKQLSSNAKPKSMENKLSDGDYKNKV